MRNKEKGFSLIELLIVVAIILIIAAIAIPNLIRSRMAANEASAVSALRTLMSSDYLHVHLRQRLFRWPGEPGAGKPSYMQHCRPGGQRSECG